MPPPPEQAEYSTTQQAEASALETQSTDGNRTRRTILMGCLGLLVLLVLLGIATVVLVNGGGTANRGDGGSNGGEKPAPVNAEGSGKAFTGENYSELISDPNAHQGAKVDVTGQIFTTPEIVEGDTAFQMFVDPENSEMNTAVLATGNNLGLETDDYVRVVGTVTGSMEGQNAFGGKVSAVAVDASKVEPVSARQAVDPAQKTVGVGRTLTDQGFSVTLEKVEFGKTTRVYVSVSNGTGAGASFYDYDTRILQGSRQFDQETTYDYEVKEPQSDLSARVRTDGVVTFGKVDSTEPMEVRFEWYSDNYDLTTHPIVFEVTPR